MLPRVLEPEAMDTFKEAREYDAMDHSEVNARFVADFLATHGPCRGGEVLDVGTGPARIPIALCRADPLARVLGIDLARAMLDRAARNIRALALADRIQCLRVDAKALPFPDGRFEAVISNTTVHHIPHPAPVLAEMARLIAPGGTLFVRDLARPESRQAVGVLVARYAGEESPAARALFEASLHAALTVEEIGGIVSRLGLPVEGVAMTSDRHWTWTWRRPG
jgi:ubiquinone/menaquinone biosynthesis C-methylase UbiE